MNQVKHKLSIQGHPIALVAIEPDPPASDARPGRFLDDEYRYVLDENDRWRRLPLHMDANVDVAFWEKFCVTCKIWRPARGHHCRKCGFCMVQIQNSVVNTSSSILLHFSNLCSIGEWTLCSRWNLETNRNGLS